MFVGNRTAPKSSLVKSSTNDAPAPTNTRPSVTTNESKVPDRVAPAASGSPTPATSERVTEMMPEANATSAMATPTLPPIHNRSPPDVRTMPVTDNGPACPGCSPAPTLATAPWVQSIVWPSLASVPGSSTTDVRFHSSESPVPTSRKSGTPINRARPRLPSMPV